MKNNGEAFVTAHYSASFLRIRTVGALCCKLQNRQTTSFLNVSMWPRNSQSEVWFHSKKTRKAHFVTAASKVVRLLVQRAGYWCSSYWISNGFRGLLFLSTAQMSRNRKQRKRVVSFYLIFAFCVHSIKWTGFSEIMGKSYWLLWALRCLTAMSHFLFLAGTGKRPLCIYRIKVAEVMAA